MTRFEERLLAVMSVRRWIGAVVAVLIGAGIGGYEYGRYSVGRDIEKTTEAALKGLDENPRLTAYKKQLADWQAEQDRQAAKQLVQARESR